MAGLAITHPPTRSASNETNRGSIETQTVHNLGKPIPILSTGRVDQPCGTSHMAGAVPLTMYDARLDLLLLFGMLLACGYLSG